MEKVQVRFTTGNGRTWAFDQSIFLDVNVPLTISSNGYFPRGQYEFPFSFVIPPGVESSMRCDIEGNDGGFAEIKYCIEARIHRRGVAYLPTNHPIIHKWLICEVHHRLDQVGCIHK